MISFDKENDLRSKGEEDSYTHCERIPFRSGFLVTDILTCLLYFKPFCVVRNHSNSMSRAIEQYIDNNEVDMVVLDQMVMGQYQAKAENCKKVLFPVDALTRQKKQKYETERGIIRKLLYYVDYVMVSSYEKYIFQEFDDLILVSPVDADYVRGYVNDIRANIHILPIGVDTEYFCPQDTEGDSTSPSMVFFGQMSSVVSERAALWFHENVWYRLKRRHPRLKWYIVGNAPTNRIRGLGADSDIIVTGYVDDYRPYVWNASLSISPLTIGTGMKNRVLQAMAMGKAVVATPLSLEGISAEHGRNVLVAEDADSFAREISSLLEDKKMARGLGLQARRLVYEKYSWQRTAEGFMDILSSVMSRGA